MSLGTIHRNMPFAAYRKLPGVNSSLLKVAQYSPFAAEYELRNPDDGDPDGERPVFLGVHCDLFEGKDAFTRGFASTEGIRRDKRTKPYQDWLDAHRGMVGLTEKQWNKVLAIRAALESQGVRHMLGNPGDHERGEGEVTVTWHDDEFGVACKARFDWLSGDRAWVVDGKNCGDLTDLESLARHAYGLSYDLQAAHYLRAAAEVGFSEIGFAHLWISGKQPHDAVVLPVSERFIESGMRRRAVAMRRWVDACQSGNFPRALHDEMDLGAQLDVPGWIGRGLDNAEQRASREQWQAEFGLL